MAPVEAVICGDSMYLFGGSTGSARNDLCPAELAIASFFQHSKSVQSAADDDDDDDDDEGLRSRDVVLQSGLAAGTRQSPAPRALGQLPR